MIQYKNHPLKIADIREGIAAYSKLTNGDEAAAKQRYVKEVVWPFLVGGKIPSGVVVKEENRLDPRVTSVREIWEGFVGPVYNTLPMGKLDPARSLAGLQEEVTRAGFATIIGQLIFNEVIQGYDQPGFIGDLLVRNVPGNTRVQQVPGFTAAQGPDRLKEGEPYREKSFTEKFVTTNAEKVGGIISVTEELITEDKTGQLLDRAFEIGEATRQEKEETILEAVLGVTNIYKPNGVAETLYDATNQNLLPSNALADWESINETRKYHAQNVKDDREGGGAKPIIWMPNTILCGTELELTASRIISTVQTREIANGREFINAGNSISSNLRALSSPLVDGILTAGSGFTNTDWYLGQFDRQFRWLDIWPLGTFQQGANSDAAFDRDIVSRYKVRYLGGIYAVDQRFVVRNTA